MAPPLPTLSTAQFSTLLGAKTVSELETCPLKRVSQFDCVMKHDLPVSGRRDGGAGGASTLASTPASTRSTALPSALPTTLSTTRSSQSAAQVAPRSRSGHGRLVCIEFYRYFRRCADVGRGPNVEVTTLMGVRREGRGEEAES